MSLVQRGVRTGSGRRAEGTRPFQKLPKSVALPASASDPISSVAFATEEILLTLTLGTAVAAVVAPEQVSALSAASMPEEA